MLPSAQLDTPAPRTSHALRSCETASARTTMITAAPARATFSTHAIMKWVAAGPPTPVMACRS